MDLEFIYNYFLGTLLAALFVGALLYWWSY